MNDTKPIWQSTTLRGLLLLLMPKLLAKLGWQFGDVLTQAFVDFLMEAIGAVMVGIGRMRAETKLTVKAPDGAVVGVLALSLACGSGCATWEGFSPGTQAALKAAAKLALSIGVSKLGESVHELRPYQDKLNGLIDVTFSKAVPPESIGAQLKAGVAASVPAPLQAVVLKEFKARLTDNSPAASPGGSYNAKIAAGL